MYNADGDELPWYCNSSSTNYRYSSTFIYEDNQCETNFVFGDIYREEHLSASLTSYFQDFPISDPGESKNAFVPDIENVTLFATHTASSGVGVGGVNIEGTMKRRDGQVLKKIADGSPIEIKISELLEMTGISLDDRNVDSGGDPPTSGMHWPLYRLTGVSILVEMKYENFRATAPFDFTKSLTIQATASNKIWNSRNQVRVWKQEDGEFRPYERFPQVVSVSFQTAGEFGSFDAFTAIMNLGIAFAIFDAVKTFVDWLGTYLLNEFYKMKTIDRISWLTLEAIRRKARRSAIELAAASKSNESGRDLPEKMQRKQNPLKVTNQLTLSEEEIKAIDNWN